MHLRSLSLRNYRVYRSVDLEFPDGLIGIYGANGSGKSTLIEALRWALYGDSRTDKWELRSAGVGDDVRVELVFEHEGNTYDVRRRLKGRNLMPEVEVFLNGQLAAQSVREANAFLARVLGMDQRAFLASVCAQQKELTAFATMLPSDRRRLVLDLLGVSPVERALARVREQGRDARTAATGARAGLPDLGQHFPSDDLRWKDASSLELCRRVAELVAAAGWRPVNLDVAVVCDRPRLGHLTASMAAELAAALGLEPAQLRVTAKRSDGLGFCGRGEGIAASAVCLAAAQPDRG